jgi:hypothetical protein
MAAALALARQLGSATVAQVGGLQQTRLVQTPARQAMFWAGVLVLAYQPSVQV